MRMGALLTALRLYFAQISSNRAAALPTISSVGKYILMVGQGNAQTGDTYGFSGRLDVDFGEVTMTSITAYEGGKSSSVGDIDGGAIIAGLGVTVPNGLPSGQTDTSFPADGIVDATTFLDLSHLQPKHAIA